MKPALVFILCLFFIKINAQKYALLDKTMSIPVSYANTVTVTDQYRNLFAVEKTKINEFLVALAKIQDQLLKKNIPESFNFYVGNTRFSGIKVSLSKEERMDVTLTTDCGNQKITMHLIDAKVSNASNAFFIKTWYGYIKDNTKNLK